MAASGLTGFNRAIQTLNRLQGENLLGIMDREIQIIAEAAVAEMKTAAVSTAPLTTFTQRIRGALGFDSGTPLMRTGALVNSITAQRIKGSKAGAWFAGIPASVQVRGSKLRMHELARMHEGGAVIAFRVTEKFQRYLLFLGHQGVIPLKQVYGMLNSSAALGKTFVITIPARPFILPAAEKVTREIVPKLAQRVSVRLTF